MDGHLSPAHQSESKKRGGLIQPQMAQALYKRLDGVVCGLAQNDKGYLLEGPPPPPLKPCSSLLSVPYLEHLRTVITIYRPLHYNEKITFKGGREGGREGGAGRKCYSGVTVILT